MSMKNILDSVEMTEIVQNDPADKRQLYATHEGWLQIGDIQIRCYQLNDGRRVLSADDPWLKKLIEGLADINLPEAQAMFKKLTSKDP